MSCDVYDDELGYFYPSFLEKIRRDTFWRQNIKKLKIIALTTSILFLFTEMTSFP